MGTCEVNCKAAVIYAFTDTDQRTNERSPSEMRILGQYMYRPCARRLTCCNITVCLKETIDTRHFSMLRYNSIFHPFGYSLMVFFICTPLRILKTRSLYVIYRINRTTRDGPAPLVSSLQPSNSPHQTTYLSVG